MSTGYVSNYPSSGYASESQLRNEFQKIQEALEDTISRSGDGVLGGQSNSMESDLDLDGNDILNVNTIYAQSIISNGQDYMMGIEAVRAAAEAARDAAQLSESNVTAMEATVQALSDNFRGTYYGSSASDPSVDPLGNTPDEGDLYFNTTTNTLRLFDGSSWNLASVDPSTLGTASTHNTATLAESLAGTVGVLPDAEQVRKNHVAQVATIADLRALEPAFDGQQVELLGHTVAGLGGGMFYSDYSSSAADDNGVTVVTPGGRRWVRRLGGYVTPLMFGASGDGVADDTAAIAASIAAGRVIDFGDSTNTYKITSTINLNAANCEFIGQGAKIDASAITDVAIQISASSVRVNGLELIGPVANDTYLATSFGIRVTGTVGARLTDVEIAQNYIHNFGLTAIRCDFVNYVNIVENRLEYCGYAGVQILSGNDCLIDKNKIFRMFPGSGAGVIGASAAYGVHITRNAALSLADAPRSERVTVSQNNVRSIPTWEGLDTHGGLNILFVGNQIQDCWVGGNAIHADGGGDLCPAISVAFVGNTFQAGNTPGAALYLKPTSQTVVGSAGPVTVSGNSIFRYGTYNTGVSTLGAIYAENCTDGLSITGNSFYECKHYGIKVYDYCYGFSITGNTFKDMLTISGINRAIGIISANNSGTINSNAFIRTSGSFEAIYIGFSTGNIVLGVDNSFTGTITKLTGEPQSGGYKQSAKAWANIDGTTGTHRDSFGLTSTRTGTGAYTITLSNPMGSTNYVPQVSSNQPISFVDSIVSTTQFTVITQSAVGVAADAGLLLISVFGD